MPRNDPTDTGGLFIGRRPGTAPLKYRDTPERLGSRRQRMDGLLAHLVLALEVLVVLTCWVAQPVGWLWFGSQVNYWTDSVFVGIFSAFAGLLVTVFGTLWLAVRLDALWRILRRAAGHDQREGHLARIFACTAAVAVIGVTVYFLVHGPGSTLVPAQPS